MKTNDQDVTFREVSWPRPFDPELAMDLLTRLAVDREIGTLIWEARADSDGIRYLVGCSRSHMPALAEVLQSHVDGVRLSAGPQRPEVSLAARMDVSQNSLALSTDRVLAAVRAVLAGLATAKPERGELVLQVMLGARVAPAMLPGKLNDPRASWLDFILGTVRPATPETRASMKARACNHGFRSTIRLGAHAENPAKARYLLLSLFGGLKVVESAGVHLRLNRESATALNEVHRPWQWPLTLSAQELVSLMGWPLGEGTLPGVKGMHPKVLPPPSSVRSSDRAFALSSAAGEKVKLGVSIRDSLQHTVLLGPTGAGKSNAMLSMVCADIDAGRGVLVIDPKTDLTRDILAHIPEHRQGDVVVIDPADPRPVGLNPLANSRRNPALVADSVLAVFKELFADSWGPRTQDILTSALLTLAQYPKASLVWLPTLLTDPTFRRKLTANITDYVGLVPFWAAYESHVPSPTRPGYCPGHEQAQTIPPSPGAPRGPWSDGSSVRNERPVHQATHHSGLPQQGIDRTRKCSSAGLARSSPVVAHDPRPSGSASRETPYRERIHRRGSGLPDAAHRLGRRAVSIPWARGWIYTRSSIPQPTPSCSAGRSRHQRPQQDRLWSQCW